jgi:hypothetical protein
MKCQSSPGSQANVSSASWSITASRLLALEAVIYRLRHQDGRVTTIPVHAGETLGPGLLRQVLHDTQLQVNDLTN